MKSALLSLLSIALMAGTANAACYADYKAKRDDPLRLHYGVAEVLGDCTIDVATLELAPRLMDADWHLLAVVSVFGTDGLEERKDSAGEHYLRY